MANRYVNPDYPNLTWELDGWDGTDYPWADESFSFDYECDIVGGAGGNYSYKTNNINHVGGKATPPSSYTNKKWVALIRYGQPTSNAASIAFGCACITSSSSLAFYEAIYPPVVASFDFTYNGTTYSTSDVGGASYIPVPPRYGNTTIPYNNPCNAKLTIQVPLFDDELKLYAYLNTGDTSGILNSGETEDEEAKKYYIYNTYGSGTVKMGVAKITQSVLTGRYENLMCVNTPCLYWVDKGHSLELRIKYNDIKGSYYSSISRWAVESADIDDYTEDVLLYSYPFYHTYTKLPDGSYTIGSMLSTNMPLFKNESDAQDFIDGNKDITDAENWPEISGDKIYDPIIDNDTGEKEESTDFGESFVRNIFSQMYLCNTANLYEISNALFDYDVTTLSGLWEDIKKGLEMYGSNPMECVQGLRFYPLDLSTIFPNVQSQNYVYFGAYKLNLTQGNVQKVIYANGYKDLGTVKIKRSFKDWRDFEPYTKLSIYLPYVGRYQLDLKKYYEKDVTVRYYIDIRTGACIACLIADGLLLDWFDGILGVEMPITLTDYSTYAQNQLNIIMRNAGIGISAEGVVGATGVKGVQGAINGAANSAGSEFANTYASMGGGSAAFTAAKGASSSAMASGAAGIAGTAALGAVAVGAVAAGVVMKTEFDMMRTGTAAYTRTRPASSSMLNQFLPQYPTFMFEIQDIDESDYLNELYGRPANASGVIGNFSGYLEAEDVLLICPIATDNERQEIIDLVKTGIYI